MDSLPALPSDQLDGLVTVLDLVRSGRATTKPELVRLSGLGRSVVTQRVAQLLESGLLVDRGRGRSTGGRAPRELAVNSSAGVVLVAPVGARHIGAGVADLGGRLLDWVVEPADVSAGPDAVLARVEALFDQLLAGDAVPRGSEVYGVGLGVPGPVEFASGEPVSPPIMPGWHRYPIRRRLAARYDAPVWVDNDVNLMALGELRAGVARGHDDVVFIKVGTGIGAGLVSAGQLHRGAQGCAGDIGHVLMDESSGVLCRCGKTGCLEALAGGTALVRDATAAAVEGRSERLLRVLGGPRDLSVAAVTEAAREGDLAAGELLGRSARLVGETVAQLVNFYNPALVVVGGSVAAGGDAFLATIRETVYRRSLPLATRELRLLRSTVAPDPGLAGAAHMVLDELLSRDRLWRWLPYGSPAGRAELMVSA